MAKLVVTAGRNVGAEYKLIADQMIMGRRSACPIPIADPKASREHALVSRKDSQHYLRDTSRNGLLINGKQVSKDDPGTPLNFGDKIKIGDTVLELVDESKEQVNIEIPGYKVMEKVGQGGMGTVYKAQQLSMDRIVALKILNEHYSSNSEFVDRFIREARAAGKLNHPNVIHVHDISRANGRHYFSMEFIDGCSIKDMMRLEKKMDLNKVLDIILQSAKALEFAHENHIVHRDVKPDNIMISREGIVKLADLGIAKTFEEAPPSVKEQRRVMGTPHYMAPEQALGKTIDHRVDIYSLGATFYHMLTGTTPFSGSTAHEILKAHIQESLPPIQELNPAVPDPVCFIIERMMAKLPEKRYPDMSKLIEDIERVRKGISDGISQIDAGESTIMRTASGVRGRAVRRTGPEEAVTGAHVPTSSAGVILALTAISALTVAAIVMIMQKAGSGDAQPGTPPVTVTTPGTTPGTTPNPNTTRSSKPEAMQLLQAAKASKANNDLADYERKLNEIRNKFPASSEAEESIKLLEEIYAVRRQADRGKAEKLFNDAKDMESKNAGVTETIAKYREVITAAANYQDIFNASMQALERLEKKLGAENAKNIEGAARNALKISQDNQTKFDFDAARKVLQDFLQQYPNAAAQKDELDQALKKIDTAAAAELKLAKEKAAGLETSAAIAVWNKYGERVKDAAGAKEAATAKDALEAKAAELMEAEMAKIGEKARKCDYTEALSLARGLSKKMDGLKWQDMVKSKEDSLKRQKELVDRFNTQVLKKLEAGHVPLPFKIETRFGDMKWTLTEVRNGMLALEPASKNAAPSFSKKFADFPPKEQYQIMMLVLPEKLSPDDHKALTAFCQERSLSNEAQMHDEKASAK